MSRFSFPWRSKTYFGGAMCAILVLTLIGDRVLNGSRGEQIHRQLVAESRSLEQMPNSTLLASVDSFSVWNSHKALVDAKYATAADYKSIQEFYDRELATRGWKSVGTQYLKVWGRDYGGKEVDYCKGPWSASLEFPGQKPGYHYTYSINFSWGLRSCE